MLNRSIVHTCGHIEWHSFESGIFGRVPRDEIERRFSELAQQPCKSCASGGSSAASGSISDESAAMSDIRDMVKAFVNRREWDRYRNPRDVAVAMAEEASELLEHVQEGTGGEQGGVDGDAEKKAKLEGDLADLFICCLIFADALGIDVARAVEDKLRQNVTGKPSNLEKGDYTNLSNI
ncbi:MAG: MazG-like family protein [Dehalococcoidia bacterium]